MFFKKILLPSARHHEEGRGDADGKHSNHNWPQTQQNGDQMPMARATWAQQSLYGAQWALKYSHVVSHQRITQTHPKGNRSVSLKVKCSKVFRCQKRSTNQQLQGFQKAHSPPSVGLAVTM